MAQYHGTSRANISEAMSVAKQLIIGDKINAFFLYNSFGAL